MPIVLNAVPIEGALVAAFLDMRLKRAMPAITLGVITAGIIVYIITYGVTLAL